MVGIEWAFFQVMRLDAAIGRSQEAESLGLQGNGVESSLSACR